MKNIKIILLLVIGIVICGVIGIKASELISSSQVFYKDDQMVSEALDELLDIAVNGKEEIASAITSKGITTSVDDSYEQMASNIQNISAGNPYLRYNEETGYIQAINDRGEWVDVYSSSKLPLLSILEFWNKGSYDTELNKSPLWNSSYTTNSPTVSGEALYWSFSCNTNAYNGVSSYGIDLTNYSKLTIQWKFVGYTAFSYASDTIYTQELDVSGYSGINYISFGAHIGYASASDKIRIYVNVGPNGTYISNNSTIATYQIGNGQTTQLYLYKMILS